MLTVPRTLALLALTSASIVTQEVLLTRLLSVTTWYSLAFAVLSLAMLGLTRGALVAARAAREGLPLVPWLSRQLARMSVALLFATAVTVFVPMTLARDFKSFALILLITGVNAVPMIAGASVVARIMSESRVVLATLYGVDLGAAALGALAPLVIVGPLSAPSATVALGVLVGVAGLFLDRSGPKIAAWGAPAACAVTVLVTQLTPYGLSPQYAKGRAFRLGKPPTIEEWNPLSYVYVTPFETMEWPFSKMWGPSPMTPHGSYSAAVAVIDGDAYTPIYRYSSLADFDFLRYDVTAAANVLRPTGTACIIGVGGGRDVLTALNFGHDHVLGVEINPAMVDILRRLGDRSPVLQDPRVETVVGDGRAVLAGSNVRCSVLQASLIDTWAATGAGAFAHTEATLYTREAWSIFLRRVEPDGILTFSRWFAPRRPSETARLVALGMASLFDRGVEHPADRIAAITGGGCATLLLSPRPFSGEDLARLSDYANRMKFGILFSPARMPDDPLLAELLSARDVDDLERAGAPIGLDTSAPTDDRPFFFQLLGLGAWLHPIRSLEMVDADGFGGGVAHVAGLVYLLVGLVGPIRWREVV